ncbi:LptA/OstA family protein [uncultured Roseobacter sp.]|uniref:LptA/OstA family protein n=1 Tax=uncultured Roseobacter sp. TaxID=114847 RepID=UPI0026239EB0|nr:LptA/OstA family protein [uncultured Roseobacter sp.]
MNLLKILTLPLFILLASQALWAQGTQVAFGALQQDKSLPVEVTAENLSVDQATGEAVFTGNVVVGQGEMRLSAKRVLVVYREETDGIERMEATGDVLLVSGPDAAESEKANYNIDDGTIVMTGNVLLTQGPSAITADRMTVQLDSGTAQMSGSVKTILRTGDN